MSFQPASGAPVSAIALGTGSGGASATTVVPFSSVTLLRVTQLGVEIAYQGNPPLLVSQLGVEIAYQGNPPLLVTQLGIEIAYSLIPNLVLTQLGVEIIFDQSSVIPPSRGGPMISLIM